MPLTTSSVTPLIVQTSKISNDYDQIMIINPDGTITYKPHVRYQQPTTLTRSYIKPAKPKYQYTVEQV